MSGATKTNGIVLKFIRYGDSSAVCKIFTRNYGLKSFMVKGAMRKKTGKQSLLQPFTPVELSFRHRDTNQLQYLQGISRSMVLLSLPFDIRKSTICLFLDELLLNTLSEDYVNQELFDFVEHFIELLDHSEKPENYHLFFLMRLSSFYGIAPQNQGKGKYFDLSEGEFVSRPGGLPTLDEEESAALLKLLQTPASQIEDLKISGKVRQKLLHGLLEYFSLHLGHWKPMRSLEILESVFH
ncbi:DNA repair protein RecO [Halocola ammonii]